MYISSYEELVSFCERAATHGVLGVDTEFLREKTFHPLLCLIQVATKDEAAAIDPLLIDDLEPLATLLSDRSKTKVFHACGQDVEVIRDNLGIVPEPLFDTQFAAAFLGHGLQMSYADLVRTYEGVRLAKADGLTDWSKRPLDDGQLTYAEEDVLYLPGIYERMMRELVRRDRLSWFMPEMEAHVRSMATPRDPREAYLHLKRSGSLSRKQLAVARELCEWREELASARNLPRKWVVQDEVILEMARLMPRSVERLRRIRATSNLSDRDARNAVEAIRCGINCDPMDYPLITHKPRVSAETNNVIDLMYAVLRLQAEREHLAVSLVGGRADLLSFLKKSDDCILRTGWRYELVGRSLEKLLDGEIGLTVSNGHVELV